MKKIITSLMVGSLIVLTGCATIMTGTRQTIHLKMIDVANNTMLSGVSCTFIDGSGNSYPIMSNPAQITVSTGSGSISVKCRKAGYKQANMAVGDNFNALTIINVLFWPGFIIDAASGAYKKYPSHYVIGMAKTK
jgi:hypothetical protein